MDCNFKIDPEIETLCEQKAREEYELAKQIEAMRPKIAPDMGMIVDEVRRMIDDNRLIVVKHEFINEFKAGSELFKQRAALKRKYAEDAVKKVMEA